MSSTDEKWTRTKFPHLYSHTNGFYYARVSIGGNRTWRSLKTRVLSVARAKLDELLTAEATRKEVGTVQAKGDRMTMADAIAIRQRQIENDPAIKRSTLHYWNQIFASLAKGWPELGDLEVRKITVAQCEEWAGRAARAMSPTRYNNSLAALKQLFEIGIEAGVRLKNPAAKIKRVRTRQKNLAAKLPTKEQFHRIVEVIRTRGGRFSKAAADLVEFLAYTGVRIGETKHIRWRHIDFTTGRLTVEGDPVNGTKNREIRTFRLIPPARALAERIRNRRGSVQPDELVLAVHEAQKSLDRALDELGMARFTHHDLRHFFATICIESNVPIPTVAKWLGHKDGGALAMKVYGHLRQEHSDSAADSVSFAA